ncbi:hypothetical protein ACQ8RP_002738, partial [Listeria monocytogenes]
PSVEGVFLFNKERSNGMAVKKKDVENLMKILGINYNDWLQDHYDSFMNDNLSSALEIALDVKKTNKKEPINKELIHG